MPILRSIDPWEEYGERFHTVGQPEIPEELMHVCSKFGCGKTLSRQDKLFGTTCPEHSGKPATTINSARLSAGY